MMAMPNAPCQTNDNTHNFYYPEEHSRKEPSSKKFSYPISHSSWAAKLFEEKADSFVKLILSSIASDDFLSLNCLLRGTDYRSAVPTVTILLKRPPTMSFKVTLEQFQFGISLDFIVRSISRTNQDAPETLRVVEMGCSIGRVGNDWSAGTLGGFLRIKKDGRIFPVGLTNHHVAFPATQESQMQPTKHSDESILGTVYTTQAYTYSTGLDKLHMENAAEKHKQARRAIDDEMIATARMGLEMAKQQVNPFNDKGQGRVDSRQKTLDLLEQRQANFHTLEAQNTSIGHVVVSSGYKVKNIGMVNPYTHKTNLTTLDWALISLNDKHAHANNILASDVGRFPIDEIGAQTDLEHYELIIAKRGCKTGLTRGRFNGVKARVAISGNEYITSEYTAVHSSDASLLFSSRSDSGALVVQGSRWVGLLFGGSPEEGTSYITPASVVVQDIEETYNCTVKLFDEDFE